MRDILTFPCASETLYATLDQGQASTGLLIVSGGNEIRSGAHRGMAKLAAEISARGFPVFRYDRRGIGDSTGENAGFEGSADDMESALDAFQKACPQMKRIVAFGNCDAAAALILHQPEGVAHAVLANIWVIERDDGMPPPAAIKAHYLDRLKSPSALIGLFTGKVSLRKLAGGLFKLAKPAAPSALTDRIAQGLATLPFSADILLANKDATAIAFADAWQGAAFVNARARAEIRLTKLDSNSHSFAPEADFTIMKNVILAALGRT